MTNAQRRSTNISLPADVVAEAKELGINISEIAERGLVTEVSVRRRLKWLDENMEAIEAHNAWVEKNGLPLAKYRQF